MTIKTFQAMAGTLWIIGLGVMIWMHSIPGIVAWVISPMIMSVVMYKESDYARDFEEGTKQD